MWDNYRNAKVIGVRGQGLGATRKGRYGNAKTPSAPRCKRKHGHTSGATHSPVQCVAPNVAGVPRCRGMPPSPSASAVQTPCFADYE